RAKAAGDGTTDACLRVTEGPRATIARFIFDGNTHMPDALLREQFDTTFGKTNVPGGVYREDLWKEHDSLYVLALYYDAGFIAVQMDPPVVDESPDGRSLDVRIAIREGAMYKVGALKIDGKLAAPAKSYLALLESRAGETFHRKQMLDDIARIKKF